MAAAADSQLAAILPRRTTVTSSPIELFRNNPVRGFSLRLSGWSSLFPVVAGCGGGFAGQILDKSCSGSVSSSHSRHPTAGRRQELQFAMLGLSSLSNRR